MTRVAVIGSSHVGALKLAWDGIGENHPEISVDYLSMQRSKFLLATLRDDMQFGLPDDLLQDPGTARHSRKLLNFKDFDIVWHVGAWQVHPKDFNEIIQAFNIDGLPATTHPHQLSQAAFRACLENLVNNVLPGPEWHNLAAPRIVFSGFPRRNAHMATRKRFQGTDPRNHAICWDIADQMLADTLAEFGISWIRQPPDTLNEHGFTHKHFGTDTKLAAGDGVDIAHMNTAFGVRMWDVFLKETGVAA